MTQAQAQQTAADLRNAALVTAAAGHTRRSAINPVTGSVCAMGALQISTQGARVVARLQTGLRTLFTMRMGTDDYGRLLRAAQALAPEIPDPCLDCRHEYPADDAITRVIHFNDHVCTGGDELAEMFVRVAEKIEANLP